ncbi:hypothetical protein DPMN_053840 [Dreissena polymorpha]|uniref:Uncharacterized protein n=1 Tax=Dreissena polymorpha TaxID=45954 RepID=A0A9D4CM46_DREPO|nr:hypothetical protein DPMN_053840 [Dreissena polymorpha]
MISALVLFIPTIFKIFHQQHPTTIQLHKPRMIYTQLPLPLQLTTSKHLLLLQNF